ncbi:MAG: Rpn family recombination-promoting nuclease/putative transposase, partial [Treponema sp.]|nr:Rpn family recombination-promoting nuclease/putative transposase [Treponema sp.]
MKTNRKLKDTVFTTLFNDPDLLRELYCALEDVNLPPDTPVSINTLKNVLFMGKYNDISFEIGEKLIVLLEHQSTINPNMALRMLMYIADVYEVIVEGKNIYSGSKITIPWPEFYVLYDGKEHFPEKAILRLSDLYEKPISLGLPEKLSPLLDLEVRVININDGINSEIVNRCKKLQEYSTFIAKVRELTRTYKDLKKAIKEAIKYCHKHDILKEFLEIHGRRVLSMLYTEWNMDDAMAVRYEEGREQGRKELQNIVAQKDA